MPTMADGTVIVTLGKALCACARAVYPLPLPVLIRSLTVRKKCHRNERIVTEMRHFIFHKTMKILRGHDVAWWLELRWH